MTASLRGIIADRQQKRIECEHPDAGLVLRATFDALSPRDTGQQSSHWFGRRWAAKPNWARQTRNRITNLANDLDPTGNEDKLAISRNHVFERSGEVDLFLAAMAWGFGPRGYGWWRTASMINPGGSNRESSIAAAVDAYKSAWATGGAAAVAGAWVVGEGAIHGLGPAFASKVAYFAAYDRVAETGPLIADLNTAWSVWALGGIWDSRYDARKYADYVEWCEVWAKKLNCASDDVERVLFRLGPAVRKIHRDLKNTSTV